MKFSKKLSNSLLFTRPEERNYYASIIRINVKDTLLKTYYDTVNRCFTLIQKYDGDVNQFLGSNILALWGVPLCLENDKENSLKFFDELESSSLPVSAILLNDKGIYGSFGNEKRLVVTAISNNISNALKELINCDGEIYINKLL